MKICRKVNKKRTTWVITMLEIHSRVWSACVVGRRSYRNIRRLFSDTVGVANFIGPPLIATDGFAPYGWAIRRIFGVACVYGQVVKTRRKDRIVRVERKLLIGTPARLEDALWESEDSHRLNTSFIERHNLTVRRGCSYLQRKTTGHARSGKKLESQLELLRCHYNFVRGHAALKYGRDTWTPAMQAGITKKPLTFRQIFMASGSFALAVCVFWRVRLDRERVAA